MKEQIEYPDLGFEEGDEVYSVVFGDGVVISVDDNSRPCFPILVKFGEAEETFTRNGKWDDNELPTLGYRGSHFVLVTQKPIKLPKNGEVWCDRLTGEYSFVELEKDVATMFRTEGTGFSKYILNESDPDNRIKLFSEIFSKAFDSIGDYFRDKNNII